MSVDRSPREKLLDLLQGRESPEVLVTPLVDGTYAAGVAGKEWVSEAAAQDLLLCAELGGYEPLFPLALEPEDGDKGTRLYETEILERSEDVEKRRVTLHTPWGDLHRLDVEKKGMSTWVTQPFLTEWAPEVVEWVAGQMLPADEAAYVARVRRAVDRVGDRGLVYAGGIVPFGMCDLYSFDTLIYHYLDHRDQWRRVSDSLFDVACRLVELQLRGGVSAIFNGDIGTESISPAILEDAFLPYLKPYHDLIHRHGGFSYFHACGKRKQFIARGYYNLFEPDIFETLAPPPTGDIDDLAWARRQLSPCICTKGNLDLDLLRNGSPEEVANATRLILEATRGYRHIAGTADAVLPGTPMENIRAMVEAAKTWHG